jgi:hypothetical protein
MRQFFGDLHAGAGSRTSTSSMSLSSPVAYCTNMRDASGCPDSIIPFLEKFPKSRRFSFAILPEPIGSPKLQPELVRETSMSRISPFVQGKAVHPHHYRRYLNAMRWHVQHSASCHFCWNSTWNTLLASEYIANHEPKLRAGPRESAWTFGDPTSGRSSRR